MEKERDEAQQKTRDGAAALEALQGIEEMYERDPSLTDMLHEQRMPSE